MTKPKPARSRRKPPQTPGERLKAAILSEYSLDPGELLLLDQASALADSLARVNQQIAAEQSLTSTGSKGQRVPSPLLRVQKEHSETLVKLLEALALPAPDEEEGELSSTRKARKAALIRWTKEARR